MSNNTIEVLVTNILNGGRKVFTLPQQKLESDSTGTYKVGEKSVTIYRDGTVAVTGRFSNREMAAVIEAVIEVENQSMFRTVVQ